VTRATSPEQQPDGTPPAIDGVNWHRRVCPGCGEDWWHASESDDGEADVDAIVGLLGVCADCRGPRDSSAQRDVRRAAPPKTTARRATNSASVQHANATVADPPANVADTLAGAALAATPNEMTVEGHARNCTCEHCWAQHTNTAAPPPEPATNDPRRAARSA
jgi:hypothetical protein